jgi:hypothetical protein
MIEVITALKLVEATIGSEQKYSDVGFLWPHPLLWTLQFRTVIPRSIYMKFGTHIKHANGSLNVEFGGDPRKTAGVMTPALECLSLEVGSQLSHSS